MQLLKDKKIIIGIIVLVIVLLSGVFYILSANKTPSASSDQSSDQQTDIIPTLTASDLGLSMRALNSNKQIMFTITKPAGIKSVDYELTYTATGDQQRGVIGTIDVQPGVTKIEPEKPLDLGSCSRNICKYDTGVTSAKLTLKISKTNGKVYQAEQSLSL